MSHPDLPKTNPRLTRKEAAEYLRVTEGTLAVWATTGRYNLPYIKVGRKCVYLQVDLDRFMENRRVGEPINFSKSRQST